MSISDLIWININIMGHEKKKLLIYLVNLSFHIHVDE